MQSSYLETLLLCENTLLPLLFYTFILKNCQMQSTAHDRDRDTEEMLEKVNRNIKRKTMMQMYLIADLLAWLGFES